MSTLTDIQHTINKLHEWVDTYSIIFDMIYDGVPFSVIEDTRLALSATYNIPEIDYTTCTYWGELMSITFSKIRRHLDKFNDEYINNSEQCMEIKNVFDFYSSLMFSAKMYHDPDSNHIVNYVYSLNKIDDIYVSSLFNKLFEHMNYDHQFEELGSVQNDI